MVEKTKAIVHKRRGPLYYGGDEAVCGAHNNRYSSVVIHKSWRWVTCKRCLRSKPKKGVTK